MTLKRKISASRRAARRASLSACLVCLIFLGAALPDSAHAQARLDAQYEATLAGIPIGRGSWTIDIGDDQYSASAFGGTAGLLKAIANGSGTGAAQGRVVNGALVATNYTASTTTRKKTEAIHIALVNGNVKDYGIDPTPPVDPDLFERPVEHRTSRPDERLSGEIFLIAGLLADKHHLGGLGALSEHRLSRVLVERAACAPLHRSSRRGQRRHFRCLLPVVAHRRLRLFVRRRNQLRGWMVARLGLPSCLLAQIADEFVEAAHVRIGPELQQPPVLLQPEQHAIQQREP